MALVIAVTTLMKANIEAYAQFMGFVTKYIDTLTRRLKDGKGAKFCQDDVLEDPMVVSLLEKARKHREFMVRVMKSMKLGPMARDITTLYAFIALIYIVAVFYVYLTVLQIQVVPADEQNSTATTVLGLLIGIVVGLFVLSQPLFAMASQAAAWERLTKTLNSPRAQATSEVLSPKREKDYLFETHKSVQDGMTWVVLGAMLLPSAIISALTAYITVLFSTVVLPQINTYVEELESQYLPDNLANLTATSTRRVLAGDSDAAGALELHVRDPAALLDGSTGAVNATALAIAVTAAVEALIPRLLAPAHEL